MIVARRFISSVYKDNLRFFAFHRESTSSIIKSRNDIQEQWEKKMKFYMKTYEDLFGITKLSEMHDKVIEIQSNLEIVREKRRKVQEEIFIVQKKLQEMQAIWHKTSMGDDMYISVVTQVSELLKEQKRLHEIFSLYDQTEREQQTTLALAINNSQDHEKTYREKNKYLSLITGIIGGILGLVGSSINNWRHRKDIKHFASDISDQVDNLQNSVEKLKLVSSTDSVLHNSTSESSDETHDLLTTIKNQHIVLSDNIESLRSLLNIDSVSKFTKMSDGHMEEILNEFETNIQSKLKNHSYINLGMIGSFTLFFTLCMLYVTRNS